MTCILYFQLGGKKKREKKKGAYFTNGSPMFIMLFFDLVLS